MSLRAVNITKPETAITLNASVARREIDSERAGAKIELSTMRADKDDPEEEKKAHAAFYPKRFDEHSLALQEPGTPASGLARIAAEAEEKEEKTKRWHNFKTP
jgi:hypothetical protein